MRIKSFYKMVEVGELRPRRLRDETVVVDAHNFFFLTYEQSGLAYTFGCESERFATYLKDYLTMFKKANIRCYFIFKGGWHNLQKRLDRNRQANIKRPIFVRNIIMDVLREMQFEYVVCEYESKDDIIELAQKLNSPIVSLDAEYCFAGHQYIPHPTLQFNEKDNTIDCGVFLLEEFQKKYNLTVDKVALFIVLRDELIFPPDVFTKLFQHLRVPRPPFQLNLYLLGWLSKYNKDQIMETIFKFISAENKKRFVEEESNAAQLMRRRPRGGLGAACARRRGAARVARADPAWFPKGVAAGHVAVDYVNLYRSKHFYGSPAPADEKQEDALIPSLEIIKYAYDLLTNFQNDGFNFVYDTESGKQTIRVGETYSIPKPAYEAEVSVFENGWESVAAFGLLEHFVQRALGPASLRRLERAPAPARLPLLALAYWARRRPGAPAAPAAVLLSYVMLDVVNDKADSKTIPKPPFDKKPLLDSTLDKNDVTQADCNVAVAIMEDYFTVSGVEKIDWKLLHALVEIQQCLAQLLALNALCGAPLRAPLLRRTYNGTLAYKLLRAAERAADPVLFLDQLLSPAPTVYAFLNGLYETYEELL